LSRQEKARREKEGGGGGAQTGSRESYFLKDI